MVEKSSADQRYDAEEGRRHELEGIGPEHVFAQEKIEGSNDRSGYGKRIDHFCKKAPEQARKFIFTRLDAPFPQLEPPDDNGGQEDDEEDEGVPREHDGCYLHNTSKNKELFWYREGAFQPALLDEIVFLGKQFLAID